MLNVYIDKETRAFLVGLSPLKSCNRYTYFRLGNIINNKTLRGRLHVGNPFTQRELKISKEPVYLSNNQIKNRITVTMDA
jgi:hypothetical protein